jgi:pimeloyl-ACP methyl ester carboxylesterase
MNGSASQEPAMVLVHGGRHGGWCWDRVAPILRAAGHAVYTPTLTGLGERRHLLSPEIGLECHIADVVATFEEADVSDAVLVAHSYAGVVVIGAMEQIAHRVRSVVFLDAQLPMSGESLLDLVDAESQARFLSSAADGLLHPVDASYWGLTDPADVAWVNSQISAQPLKTYQDRLESGEKAWSHPGMFIECATALEAAPVPLERARQRAASDPDFHYRIIDACHDAMVTEPEAVARLLIEAATLAPSVRQEQ